MLVDASLIVAGGLLLFFGAGWLVRGASGLAAKLRVKPLIIGLTVVAYGTSTPELVVGVGAALTGRGGIAFGNAIGSNVANIGLILGLTALISPPEVDASLRRRELPVLALTAAVVPLLLLDGRVSRVEGGALLAIAAAYTFAMIRASRASAEEVVAEAAEVAEEARRAVGAPRTESSAKLVVVACIGLACLLLGGNWLVDGASRTATTLGVSQRIIGLTIVAVGTSLPELATSLVAARRGHSELAVGNVVGSNIFNVLLILGASGFAHPFEVSLRESRLEIGGFLAMTALVVLVLGKRRVLRRGEGAVLVVAYVLFLAGLAVAPR